MQKSRSEPPSSWESNHHRSVRDLWRTQALVVPQLDKTRAVRTEGKEFSQPRQAAVSVTSKRPRQKSPFAFTLNRTPKSVNALHASRERYSGPMPPVGTHRWAASTQLIDTTELHIRATREKLALGMESYRNPPHYAFGTLPFQYAAGLLPEYLPMHAPDHVDATVHPDSLTQVYKKTHKPVYVKQREEKVRDELIEALEKEDDKGGGGLGPRFKEGMRVKSRYRGRSKEYPGTISKAHPDGTFDVDYDDPEALPGWDNSMQIVTEKLLWRRSYPIG